MKVIFHSISLFLSCWFPLTANRKPLGTETENCNICLTVLLKHSHVREHVTYYIYVLCCVKHCIDWSTLLFQPCIPYLILHEITFINNGLGILFGITLLWVCIFSLYVSICVSWFTYLPPYVSTRTSLSPFFSFIHEYFSSSFHTDELHFKICTNGHHDVHSSRLPCLPFFLFNWTSWLSSTY